MPYSGDISYKDLKEKYDAIVSPLFQYVTKKQWGEAAKRAEKKLRCIIKYDNDVNSWAREKKNTIKKNTDIFCLLRYTTTINLVRTPSMSQRRTALPWKWFNFWWSGAVIRQRVGW